MPSLSEAAILAPERSKTFTKIIIDLTNSDNEDEEIQIIRRPPPSTPAPSAFRSFDGLPHFDFTQATPSRPAPILPPRSKPISRRSIEPDPSNPAKRRRTETPPVAQHVTRILPPAPSYQRPAVAAPPPAPIAPVKSSSAQSRTVLDDASRQGPISNLGRRIQETRFSQTQRVKQSLNDLIIKLVKASLLHHPTLPSELQSAVVVKVVKELLDPALFSEYSRNNGQLPEGHHNTLRRRCQVCVNRLVGQHELLHEDSSYSASNSEVEETFERVTKPARNYSSSPTTSLDHNDGDFANDIRPIKRCSLPAGSSSFSAIVPVKILAHTQDSIQDHKPRQSQTRKSSYNPNGPTILLSQSPRPYLKHEDRESIRAAIHTFEMFMSKKDQKDWESSSMHVDFSLEEIKVVYILALNAKRQKISRVDLDFTLPQNLASLLGDEGIQTVTRIRRNLRTALESENGKDKGMVLLKERDDTSICNFLQDAISGKLCFSPQVVKLEVQVKNNSKRNLRLSHLLLQREISGQTPSRVRSGKESLRSQVISMLEDQIIRQSEWTDCCGDIAAITWTSKTAFICGATAHSDFHNMQYNKPGNLIVGSTLHDTLKSLPNHRVVRPAVAQKDNAENALQSMRNTQDPWLYTSVVSTAFSKACRLTFSGSFDQTVKIWSVPEDGSTMELQGAWYHEAKVNFVVTSDHHEMVATACDVSIDAVRVYLIDQEDPSQSPYDEYCGNRAQGQGQGLAEGDDGKNKKWAYFPATIQWGRAHSVSRLLLVGYSPRSLTEDDSDIPEDKRNTGELCLWNTEAASKVTIASASMQNVFEVIWHPSQPIFLAATSPSGTFEPLKTKTQIRIFGQTANGTWTHLKALDCPALDINELTIMPNSRLQSYVTASCTDGNTYVYDTAQGDQPIHILKHGESLDNPLHDVPREIADTGVKFAAWGQSKNRFYTGASDGKVKAWDITAPPCHAFIRDVLVVSAGISVGAFSQDFSQLVVGDASGKVHLLSIDDSELEEGSYSADEANHDEVENLEFHSLVQTQSKSKQALRRGGILPNSIKRPKVVIPHPEPAPPKGFQQNPSQELEKTGPEIARELVRDEAIEIHPNPAVGAVQGRFYAQTNYFRYEAHEDLDGTAPLLLEWQAKQRTSVDSSKNDELFPVLPTMESSNPQQHARNCALDLKFEDLSLETQEEFENNRIKKEWIALRHSFEHELFPGKKFELFRDGSGQRRSRKSRDPAVKRNLYLLQTQAELENKDLMVID